MRMIEIYKVIFCSQSKKYKIIFRTLENDKEFILYFEAQYAKNIAMASENIISISLSQYELFINLLNDLGLKIISCGGKQDNFKLREQLTDGANSFVLEPGKIIMYNCNDYTILELEKNGYKHISSQSFYTDPLTFEKVLRSDSKVVISINGSELVKGRGGPRCMTLPIKRGLI